MACRPRETKEHIGADADGSGMPVLPLVEEGCSPKGEKSEIVEKELKPAVTVHSRCFSGVPLRQRCGGVALINFEK